MLAYRYMNEPVEVSIEPEKLVVGSRPAAYVWQPRA